MFRSRRRAFALATIVTLVAGGAGHAQSRFPGVGRPATPAEIRAWDIDVRPDFTGLPPGSGSVARGQEVWEARCASCHGVFGESNQMFVPIVGGTTADDVRRGRVAALTRPGEQRTTMMKLAHVSTLWDYVNRAMPWEEPKSLSVNDVYAVVAFTLHLADVVPADFVLGDRNIREVQDRLPNRDGLTRVHGLWDVRGTPDVKATPCLRECRVEGRVTSELPERARDSHGDLAVQHRLVGPVRGADTTRPALTGPGDASREARERLARLAPAADPAASAGTALITKHACVACHALDQKLVGPSFREIAGRYRSAPAAVETLVERMRTGGAGTWGQVPMPPQAHVDAADLTSIARFITDLK